MTVQWVISVVSCRATQLLLLSQTAIGSVWHSYIRSVYLPFVIHPLRTAGAQLTFKQATSNLYTVLHVSGCITSGNCFLQSDSRIAYYSQLVFGLEFHVIGLLTCRLRFFFEHII